MIYPPPYPKITPLTRTCSPGQMPTGLVAWFRADTGLFQDSARTIPVTTNGQTVGGWTDLSGSANHATQTNPALEPTYETAVIGIYAGIRHGNGFFLTTPAITAIQNTALTVFSVSGRPTDPAAQNPIYAVTYSTVPNGPAGSPVALWRDTAGGTWQIGGRDGAGSFVPTEAATGPAGDVCIYTLTTGGNQTLQVGATRRGTSSGATQDRSVSQGIQVAGRLFASTGSSAATLEFACWATVLAASDINQLVRYAKARYGL